jgi:tetratricopeptide (TPR) repeat protein
VNARYVEPTRRARELIALLAEDPPGHRGILDEARWLLRRLAERNELELALQLDDAMKKHRRSAAQQEEERFAADLVTYAEQNARVTDALCQMADARRCTTPAADPSVFDRLLVFVQRFGVTSFHVDRELLRLATQAEDAGEYRSAVDLLRLRLDLPPGVEDCLHSRHIFQDAMAHDLFWCGEYAEALRHSEACLAFGLHTVPPSHARSLHLHATILAALGRWEEADSYAAAAIEVLSAVRVESQMDVKEWIEDLDLLRGQIGERAFRPADA